MSPGVDGDAADLTEYPVIRQRLWPGRIDRKDRNLARISGTRQRRCAEQRCGCDDDRSFLAERGFFAETCDGPVPTAAKLHRRHAILPHFALRVFPLGRQSISRRDGSQLQGMGKTVASKKIVIAREGGRSSTPRLLDSTTIAAGILV